MRKGFTLVELIVVLVILAVLAAMLIPSLVGYIEKSLEASDILDVRMAYIDVMTAVTEGDTANMDKTVKLKQKQDDWQSGDPITIAGVAHYKKDGDTANWKGVPAAKGECEVYYDPAVGIVFYWKGKGGSGTGGIDWKDDLHGILDRTGILTELKNKNNTNFEIDSQCPDSDMVTKVKQEIGENSLLNYGTWAYMGNPSKSSNRYLFWTSVDTNAAGAGKKIPIIVSRADGGYYLSAATTAKRTTRGKTYITIMDHTANYQQYTSGKKYETLEDAYKEYEQLLSKEEYAEYKDTLPK